MKKNYIKFSAVLGLMALSLSSCSDSFLDVESKTESNTETYYKTETDAYRAVVGCYDGWRQTSSNPGLGFYVVSEVLGAECFGGTGTSDSGNYQAIDRFDKNECPSDMNIMESDWKRYYEAVLRCNNLITRENQIAWKDSVKHGTYIGEARAIRALCYFDMVRLWGYIPLYLDTDIGTAKVQAEPAEVFNAIFSDLKYAAENIPASAYPKSLAASNDGHITKYAAEAMLARVYLFYTGYYGQEPAAELGITKETVLAGLEDVISSGEYALVSEYKNLWRPACAVCANNWADCQGTYAGDGNKEVLLSMKFTSTQDYNGNNDGNRWLVMMGIRGVNCPPYHYGWGACTVNPSVLSYYKSGDTRLAASVIDLDAEGASALDGFADDCIGTTRDYTGYAVKKYQPLAALDADGGIISAGELLDHTCGFQENGFQDFVIMRYADVLLMAAELGSANAQQYLNMVRDRAFGDTAHEVSATKENILAERKIEFAFEGINYWDLLRQGLDVAAKALTVDKLSVKEGGKDDVINISADNFKAKKGLVQIPNNQITLSNGLYKQNPGW